MPPFRSNNPDNTHQQAPGTKPKGTPVRHTEASASVVPERQAQAIPPSVVNQAPSAEHSLNAFPGTLEEALVLVQAYRAGLRTCPNREHVDATLWSVVVGDGQEFCLKEDLDASGTDEFEAQFEGVGVTPAEAAEIRESVEALAGWDRVQALLEPHATIPGVYRANFSVWSELVLGFEMTDEELAERVLEVVQEDASGEDILGRTTRVPPASQPAPSPGRS